MESLISELQILRILADSDKIQLLTSLLEQAEHGIRVRPHKRGAQHSRQIEIELHAFGSALQHADLLGSEFDSDVPSLQSACRSRQNNLAASLGGWGAKVMGSNSPAEEIGSMISTAIDIESCGPPSHKLCSERSWRGLEGGGNLHTMRHWAHAMRPCAGTSFCRKLQITDT